MARPIRRGITVAATAAALLAPAAAHAAPPPGTVTGTATLPDIPLGEFSNALLPGTVADDRGVDLGGIGSDLYPAGRPGEFWTVTDRGPNGQIKVDGDNRRTFPVPGFDPAIVRVRVHGKRLDVVKAIPITTAHGKPVTGLSNQPVRDETPYNYNATAKLDLNPNGLDTEGVVPAHDGTFWLVDEYGPSLVHVSAKGRVLARYVPKGLSLTGADYPVIEALPSIFLTRKGNRGFEGLTALPGGDLVIALQSPLLNPTKAVGNASRTTRLLRFSPRLNKVTAEYAYRFDPVNVVDPSATDTSDLKISALAAIGPETLLVQERTDNTFRLHRVTLTRKANILNTPWNAPTTTPSLEALPDPAAAGVPVLSKRLAIDFTKVPGTPKKVEGIAVLNPWTIALINDNDFGMTDGPAAFDANGRLVDSGVQTTLVTVRLTTPLR
ncbi:esterase-like activity of phytase family protein [Actinomadura rayongensis]|uniref:Esterase-like activity of phytase family protein n=1 Tax=Actinomadura rayongensis TaxID=1429076 RepID=A0A6I4W8S7_9ACTN|nr:esterase-like activity of phytase family protein [Actinomadura rayongensis]MXQ65210.1 esterase-like activity of phytase family protein [Actinomadura rayongensis]